MLQEVIKTVYGAGKGNLDDKKRIGSVYHNLGIVNGILNVEAIRIAQAKFGKRTLTGDEVRWGFEHLQLDPARVEALGAKDLFHSINVTWDNHEGDGRVTFQQWDGSKWKVVSGWIAPDWAFLRPIIEKSAAAYAKGTTSRSAPRVTIRSATEASTDRGSQPAPASANGMDHAMSDVLLSVEGLAATYNHAIAAVSDVSLAVRRGRDRRGAWRQRRRQVDHVAGGLGAAGGPPRPGYRRPHRVRWPCRHRRGAGELVRAPAWLPVLEGRHCFASLTVEENLVTGAMGRDARRAEIAADLDRVCALFPHLKRASPLARRPDLGRRATDDRRSAAPLMSRPRLLVLDEPSMGLAPLVVEAIFLALKQLNREQGLSILVAEQNSTVALRFSDHAVVLENGRSVLSGTAAELRQRADIKSHYLGGSSPRRFAPETAEPGCRMIATRRN